VSDVRVLLTGASGFVGRRDIGPLLDLSIEVHAVGNTVTEPAGTLPGTGR